MGQDEHDLFRRALQCHPEAAVELPAETFRRYAHGMLPKALRWLLRHPAMLRTLAEQVERQTDRSGKEHHRPWLERM